MRRVALAVVGLVVVIAARVATAQDGDFAVDWWTVDGGGGTSTGGDFAVTGVIGQHDAAASSGDVYVLRGGFFSGAAPTPSPYEFEHSIPGVAKEIPHQQH